MTNEELAEEWWAANCDPDCAERTACEKVGGIGHFQCGTCPEHNRPRHHCGCVLGAAGVTGSPE